MRRLLQVVGTTAAAGSDRMASLVSQPRRSIQMYWVRRNYQRLGSPSRHLRVARLGGSGSGSREHAPAGAVRRRLSWKARAARHVVRLRAAVLLSPLRLLVRLRDAYVDAMLALAGGAGRPCAALAKSRSGAEAGLWAKRVPRALQGRARSGGDFERRMTEHIYNMLVTPELPGAATAYLNQPNSANN